MNTRHSLLQALCLASFGSLVTAGPCDIYANGKTPCVAAHSTTRALYNAYNGPLYQVQRDTDQTYANITPLQPGGVANATIQEVFCAGTTCNITVIYDQSLNGNSLTRAPPGVKIPGPLANGSDYLARAKDAPATLGGFKVYGVYITPGVGYRIDATKGVAVGNAPEGLYAVVDGTNYNNVCCFDYGNAETDNQDDGPGTMESLYFGSANHSGYGAGSGPWIMADLENGLYSGYNRGLNSGDPTINYRFVTEMLRGSADIFALSGGNAASGGLSSFYYGPRPSGYTSKKQGAIILGIGGDNSHGAQGTFYEGVLTSGFPSNLTQSMVQANIVSASYAPYPTSGSRMVRA